MNVILSLILAFTSNNHTWVSFALNAIDTADSGLTFSPNTKTYSCTFFMNGKKWKWENETLSYANVSSDLKCWFHDKQETVPISYFKIIRKTTQTKKTFLQKFTRNSLDYQNIYLGDFRWDFVFLFLSLSKANYYVLKPFSFKISLEFYPPTVCWFVQVVSFESKTHRH